MTNFPITFFSEANLDGNTLGLETRIAAVVQELPVCIDGVVCNSEEEIRNLLRGKNILR